MRTLVGDRHPSPPLPHLGSPEAEPAMRILHVIITLNPAYGGPPKVAASLAASQAKLGHTAEILCGDIGSINTTNHPLLADIPGAADIALSYAPSVSPRVFLPGSSLPTAVVDAVKRCDIVHLHGVWEPLLASAAIAAKRLHRPYIVLPHGMLAPWSLSQRYWKKRLAMWVYHRRMLNEAAAIQLLNADEQSLVQDLGLVAREVIIPNGVFEEEIEPLPEPGRFRTSRPELANRRFVLFLGRLHYVKGLDVLCDAFGLTAEAHPDVDLVVAGPDDGYQDEFLKRVADSGLSSRVHLVGPIYGRDKFAAFVDAECFCLPSRQEGFSVAIIEAMASGCVPVISEGCHFPEVAAHEAGIVVELDAAKIEKALRFLLDDPMRSQVLGRNARRMVAQRLTWPSIAEATVNLYKQISTRL